MAEGRPPKIWKIAILAVGGQGGGVLAGWITALAEREGWQAQSTSVAGVAQRTGATIYYVEMAADQAAKHGSKTPVFALSPAPGDVDLVIAAEMMEAGRAVTRGFVTPDRTTLIASDHRILAAEEKIHPADGRADAAGVRARVEPAAARFLAADFETPARAAGSVISASLFGALAASGALPFSRDAFEAVIREGGRSVQPSLEAFDAGFALAADGGQPTEAASIRSMEAPRATGPADQRDAFNRLERRVAALPEPVRAMASAGLQKVVDFQDTAYGAAYLNRLDTALAGDGAAQGWAFSIEAAKHIANAMAYDDVIRVADLKTRSGRTRRLRAEAGVAADGVLAVTEYFHPRLAEVVATLPTGLGSWLDARPGLSAGLARLIDRGRRLRSDGVLGFLALYLVAGLRPYRRKLLRHEIETAHLQRWFEHALGARDADYALGVEVLRCRRLIKGYSDTYARGQAKFDRVMAGLTLVEGRADAAAWILRLREAALADEKGETLAGALRTIQSFAEGSEEGGISELDGDAGQHHQDHAIEDDRRDPRREPVAERHGGGDRQHGEQAVEQLARLDHRTRRGGDDVDHAEGREEG
jgi:indolepyruvate ferredoxin oxidoreductase beta subunit